MICNGCGNEYSKITLHWSQTDCTYPKISDNELELFRGLLLGDGTYVAQTISIPQLSDIRNKWYPDGEKKYPNNLKLTPFMAKLWYCGDGGLNWNRDRAAYANIKCSNESDNYDKIIDLFRDCGFNPTFRQERICFNSETERFLNWIGKPLPGFEYKWENVDRGSYNKLKNLSYI